jgi:hypothetical protein
MRSPASALTLLSAAIAAALAVASYRLVPHHRVSAYPYHSYEWDSSWLKTEKLGGLTFRLAAREEWAERVVQASRNEPPMR